MRDNGAIIGNALKAAAACVPAAWMALSPGVAHGQTAAEGLVKDYCVKCHNAEDWAGSLAFDTMDVGHVATEPAIWEKTITKLRGRLMPPAGASQPSQGDVDKVIAYLETSIDSAAKARPVGHVPLQRLNRTEIATSIRELIGVDINPRQALPTEVEVEGFNNIARALAVSPAFTEQYLQTVRRAARLAVGEPLPKMAKVTIPVQPAQAKDFPLGTSGGTPRRGVSFTHVFPADGEYHFNVPEEDFLDAGLYPRGMQTEATLVVLVDGVEVARKPVGGPEFLDIADRDGPAGKNVLLQMVASSAQVEAGRHNVVMTYIERSRALSNDAAVGAGGGPFGGGIRVSDVPILQTAIEIEGPFQPHGLSMGGSRAKIFVCTPKGAADEKPCAEEIARQLATRAYRRPVTDADIAPLMKSFELGRAEPGAFDAGVTELVTAVLSSPDFLYRSIATAPQPHETRLLSDLELASRLSFFLWNTGPDQQLIELAVAKKLSDPATMQAQVSRMLKDSRAQALVENFALAWLNVDELYQVEPQDRSFTDAMRTNFETEIRLFLASVLLENRSVTDLLNADWTFVNESLAQHYGIKGVLGPQFRRVKLDSPVRYGLLGKGAVLMRTSYGDRTSPVLRGAWILDRIMGTPPTPPPPGVETDLSVKEGQKVTTIRVRLEAHRKNPSCNACHGLIDPPGFALENFDGTGRWRTTDPAARAPIDARTELTSGKVIDGPVELRQYLASRPDQFPLALTRRLMMFALNREVEYFDMPTIRQIVHDAASSNYAFDSLITGIVNSDAFRRQGPEEKPATVAATAHGTDSQGR